MDLPHPLRTIRKTFPPHLLRRRRKHDGIKNHDHKRAKKQLDHGKTGIHLGWAHLPAPKQLRYPDKHSEPARCVLYSSEIIRNIRDESHGT